jgi:2-methylisocitrate lyase-like PEP mutase family enzyme
MHWEAALDFNRGIAQVMLTQAEKGRAFRALHEGSKAFIIPNPWDAGTARLLAQLGFAALATTSAGFAFSRGVPDNAVGRATMMEHLSCIASATALPVSADLVNGYGDSAEAVEQTIRLAAAAGVVGGSIEDATQRPAEPLYELKHAADRIRAAAAAARSLPFTFTLTARAENYLVGQPNLAQTIERLQAYQDAGADVLYAPGLTKREDIAAVVRSLDKPVNAVMGFSQGSGISLSVLSDIGVKRVSVGSALSRAALGAFIRAVEEMRSLGTFEFADEAVSYQTLNAAFAQAAAPMTPRTF